MKIGTRPNFGVGNSIMKVLKFFERGGALLRGGGALLFSNNRNLNDQIVMKIGMGNSKMKVF